MSMLVALSLKRILLLLSLFVCYIYGFRTLHTAGRMFRTSSLLAMSADSHSPIEQLGRVTMYKKELCPYCKKAKELLENKYALRINYVDVEDPDPARRDEILQQMRTFSGGRNTVPQIFFNSDHLGGNDDVQKLDQEGLLAKKVEAVRKTPVSMMMDHWFHPWY